MEPVTTLETVAWETVWMSTGVLGQDYAATSRELIGCFGTTLKCGYRLGWLRRFNHSPLQVCVG